MSREVHPAGRPRPAPRADRAVRRWEIRPLPGLTAPRRLREAPPASAACAADPAADLIAQAEARLRLAREEAEQLLQRARAEAAELREAARQEGFAEGESAGRAEWAARRDHLRTLTTGLAAAYRRFCEEQAPELAALTVEATAKLLGEQLAFEPERVLVVVHEALEHALSGTRLILHLHPDDVEVVREGLPSPGAPVVGEAAASPRSAPAVRLQPDPTVERGGCWIESDQGEVDATVSGRLWRLARALRDP